MCYYKKSSNDKLQTARKDIVVYKTCRLNSVRKNGFVSYYQDFRYHFDKEYKTNLHNSVYDSSLEYGFHSYRYLPKYISQRLDCKKRGRSVSEIISNSDSIVIECIIPKGAHYFHNGTDYISDKIKPICFIVQDDKQIKGNLKRYYNIK